MAKPTFKDTATGEIVTVQKTARALAVPPKPGTVTLLSKVAGENPPALNLRDNRDRFAGKDITIMEVKWKDSNIDGKKGSFVLIAGFVTLPDVEPKPDDFVIVMTGSENIQARLADAEMQAGEGSPYPLKARFRCSQGGRAWFLD